MEKYEKIRLVGRGAYGTVFLCNRISDRRLVIVKEIPVDQMSGEDRQASLNEAKVLSMFDHPNIIAYYENFLQDKSMIIVMEYAEGGTLYDFLQHRSGNLLSEEEVLLYFAQVVLALQHIHSRFILHRDIKSQNILLSGNGDIVKIGDFGISKILSSKSKAYTVVGTPCYISPELCEGKPYNQKSDIWALGCILYELLTLRRPFDANNLPALVMKIMRGSFDPVSDTYSKELRQLLMNMLHLDPNRRPTVCQIMSQPFIINTVFRLYVNIGSLPCSVRPRKLSSRSSLSQVISVLHNSPSSDTRSCYVEQALPVGSSVMRDICKVWLVDAGTIDTTPVLLPLPMEKCIIKKVSIGGCQKVGVTNDGSIVMWQNASNTNINNANVLPASYTVSIMEEKFPMNICSAICGEDFTICLTDNGVVLTFGKGSTGCLGHGNEDDVLQPKIVEALFGFNILSVACGAKHVLAVSEENNLFAWGYGKNGCLGLGKAESHALPQNVTIASGQRAAKVFCGVDCSFVITTAGLILACGSNRHNKLAMDTEEGHHLDEARVFTPVHSDPLPQVKASVVAAGIAHTTILTEQGEVYTIGSNRYGQLGWGKSGMTHSMPGKVEALKEHIVCQISCGHYFTLAVTTDNHISAWGRPPEALFDMRQESFSATFKPSFLNEEFITCIACTSDNCLIISCTSGH